LKHHAQGNLTIVHYSALYNAPNSLEALINFIKKQKITFSQPQTHSVPFLSVLLSEVTESYGSALHMSILESYEKIATILISNGVTGFNPVGKEEYEGLDIGGQKSTWALEHRDESGRIAHDESPILTAAYFNQTKMIEFFINQGEELWKTTKKEVGKGLLEENETYFQLEHVEEYGYNAFHYAIFNNSMEALKMLIDCDQKFSKKGERLMDNGGPKGVTPLMVSVSDKKWIESTKLLLDAGANVNAVTKKRGWNALHFAVTYDNTEATQLLLQHMNTDQGNVSK
jgi:hypothetical protein